MLGVLHGVVPSHPWELLVLIYFIIGQGSNMTNCVAITTNVRNFLPKDKGKVVGTLKMNFGVRVAAAAAAAAGATSRCRGCRVPQARLTVGACDPLRVTTVAWLWRGCCSWG